MSAEDIEYMDDYKLFPTKESALDWLDNYLSLDERNNLIRALQQEPRTGHWIIKDGKEQGYDIGGVKTWYIQIMCDKCGFIKTAIEGHTGQYNFCPNCGAKMAVTLRWQKVRERNDTD